jgi:asparagine synthase (glutamine-hydrolysing)
VTIAKDIKPKLVSFSMSYEGAGRSLDEHYASLLTACLQIDHTCVKFTKDDIEDAVARVIEVCETDDPQTIRASVPMYLLAEYIREYTPYRMILSGEGADELFGGYSYFSRAPDGEAGRLERYIGHGVAQPGI